LVLKTSAEVAYVSHTPGFHLASVDLKPSSKLVWKSGLHCLLQ